MYYCLFGTTGNYSHCVYNECDTDNDAEPTLDCSQMFNRN